MLIDIRDLPDLVRADMEDAEYTGLATAEEWFRRWCEWEGIVGYHATILSVVRSLGLADRGDD